MSLSRPLTPFFVLPSSSPQQAILHFQFSKSWKFVDIFIFKRYLLFLFFYEAPFRVQRHRYEFSTGTNGIKDFAFVALYNATNNDNRCLTVERVAEKKEVIGGY